MEPSGHDDISAMRFRVGAFRPAFERQRRVMVAAVHEPLDDRVVDGRPAIGVALRVGPRHLPRIVAIQHRRAGAGIVQRPEGRRRPFEFLEGVIVERERARRIFCWENRRVILADDMGVGKTLPAIRAATGRIIVICPATVKANWRREILREKPDARVLILSGTVPSTIEPDVDFAALNYDIAEGWLGRRQGSELAHQLSQRDWTLVSGFCMTGGSRAG
jgi:hypothetical protein